MNHAKALNEVKRLLVSKMGKNTDECLYMVDSIQRLGIQYYFEDEIAAILDRKHIKLRFQSVQGDLSKVAFQFRMLRQQGYYISTGSCAFNLVVL